MIRLTSCLLLCLAASATHAQEAPTRQHFANPGHEAAYHDWHHTPVVKVGDMVNVSGIPAAGDGTYEERSGACSRCWASSSPQRARRRPMWWS